jgi:hypothetical protein
VLVNQQQNQQQLQHNVLAPHKKEQDARIKQLIQAAGAICINKNKIKNV